MDNFSLVASSLPVLVSGLELQRNLLDVTSTVLLVISMGHVVAAQVAVVLIGSATRNVIDEAF